MRCEWIESTKTVTLTPGALEAQGLYYERVDVGMPLDSVDRVLTELREKEGYTNHDIVTLDPNHPKLESLKHQFAAEHKHSEDEVRLILEGEGTFDVRDRNNSTDDWMRIHVEAGDLLIVPAHRYHRFFLGTENTIKAVRLFKKPGGWVAKYRSPSLRAQG